MSVLTMDYLKEFETSLDNALKLQHVNYISITTLYDKMCLFLRNFNCKGKEEASHFMRCTMKYIECISCYAENPEPNTRALETFCKIIRVIPKSPNLQVEYLKEMLSKLVEIVTDLAPMCFVKELLISFYLALFHFDKNFLHKCVSKNALLLYKLADILHLCGDYNYQVKILEIIFYMCSQSEIEEYAKNCFPESKTLQKSFQEIQSNNFNLHIRVFLNEINCNNDLIVSCECEGVMLDSTWVTASEGITEKKLWMDFNKGSSTVSILCDADTLINYFSSNNWDANEDYKTITVHVADVQTVLLSRWLDQNYSTARGSIVCFNLTKLSFGSYTSYKPKQLKVVILNGSSLDMLENNVLPTMFKGNFKKLSPPVSVREKQQKMSLNTISKKSEVRASVVNYELPLNDMSLKQYNFNSMSLDYVPEELLNVANKSNTETAVSTSCSLKRNNNSIPISILYKENYEGHSTSSCSTHLTNCVLDFIDLTVDEDSTGNLNSQPIIPNFKHNVEVYSEQYYSIPEDVITPAVEHSTDNDHYESAQGNEIKSQYFTANEVINSSNKFTLQGQDVQPVVVENRPLTKLLSLIEDEEAKRNKVTNCVEHEYVGNSTDFQQLESNKTNHEVFPSDKDQSKQRLISVGKFSETVSEMSPKKKIITIRKKSTKTNKKCQKTIKEENKNRLTNYENHEGILKSLNFEDTLSEKANGNLSVNIKIIQGDSKHPTKTITRKNKMEIKSDKHIGVTRKTAIVSSNPPHIVLNRLVQDHIGSFVDKEINDVQEKTGGNVSNKNTNLEQNSDIKKIEVHAKDEMTEKDHEAVTKDVVKNYEEKSLNLEGNYETDTQPIARDMDDQQSKHQNEIETCISIEETNEVLDLNEGQSHEKESRRGNLPEYVKNKEEEILTCKDFQKSHLDFAKKIIPDSLKNMKEEVFRNDNQDNDLDEEKVIMVSNPEEVNKKILVVKLVRLNVVKNSETGNYQVNQSELKIPKSSENGKYNGTVLKPVVKNSEVYNVCTENILSQSRKCKKRSHWYEENTEQPLKRKLYNPHDLSYIRLLITDDFQKDTFKNINPAELRDPLKQNLLKNGTSFDSDIMNKKKDIRCLVDKNENIEEMNGSNMFRWKIKQKEKEARIKNLVKEGQEEGNENSVLIDNSFEKELQKKLDDHDDFGEILTKAEKIKCREPTVVGRHPTKSPISFNSTLYHNDVTSTSRNNFDFSSVLDVFKISEQFNKTFNMTRKPRKRSKITYKMRADNSRDDYENLYRGGKRIKTSKNNKASNKDVKESKCHKSIKTIPASLRKLNTTAQKQNSSTTSIQFRKPAKINIISNIVVKEAVNDVPLVKQPLVHPNDFKIEVPAAGPNFNKLEPINKEILNWVPTGLSDEQAVVLKSIVELVLQFFRDVIKESLEKIQGPVPTNLQSLYNLLVKLNQSFNDNFN